MDERKKDTVELTTFCQHYYGKQVILMR